MAERDEEKLSYLLKMPLVAMWEREQARRVVIPPNGNFGPDQEASDRSWSGAIRSAGGGVLLMLCFPPPPPYVALGVSPSVGSGSKAQTCFCQARSSTDK